MRPVAEAKQPQVSPLTLAVLVAAVLVAVTAGDMVVAVLPLVAAEFGASEAQVGWVLTGYLLVLAVGIPLYGRSSDVFDLRRVFSLALLVCAAGSLVCALAPNLAVLVTGRLVQGAGGAAIPVLSVVAVTRMLPPGQQGGRLGLIASSGGVGTAVGPILGGAVGQSLGWSGLFWIKTVLALLLVPAARNALSPSVPNRVLVRAERRFDLAGAGLLGLAVGLFLFGITRGQVAGFASPLAWGSLLGAALSAGLFGRRNRRVAQPFVPPSLLSNRRYVAAVPTGFLAMFT